MMISQLLFADDSLVFFKTKLGEAEKLREFLRRYELISGQQINFDKSGLFFSPNTTETDRSRLMETFGVRQCHNVETYLGLPTHIDRAKKKHLSTTSKNASRSKRMVGTGKYFLALARRR